ncbi:MAG: hypothetical protein AAF447_28495 [Myxococcota bacterium]
MMGRRPAGPRRPRLIALALLSGALSVGALLAAPAAAQDEEDEANAAETEIVEGGNVKVFRFSGFDISGQLKSPQLLYFLNRLRAEFDLPKLPHRSFLPELERTTKERPL